MNDEPTKKQPRDDSILISKVNCADDLTNVIGNMISDIEGKLSEILRPPIPDVETKLDRTVKSEESAQSELGDRLDRLYTRLDTIHGRLNQLYARIDN